MPVKGNFNETLGKLYRRGEGDLVCFALRVESRHLNAIGVAHGGFLATVADVALYRGFALEDSHRGITVSLNFSFVGVARMGDWLEIDVNVQRRGTTLAFVNCDLRVGDAPVGHANAVIRVR
jgi:acyl-coenzyme A thioesterase PaaI-like protein